MSRLRRLNFRSMSIWTLLLFSISFFFIKSSQSDLQSNGQEDQLFRRNVLRILKKNNFVKDATCAQFSSLVLARQGLPEIGKEAPIRGTRGNMDRRFDKLVPPVFSDDTVWSQNPYKEFMVAAWNPREKYTWTLALTRILGTPGKLDQSKENLSMKIKTTFNFRLEPVRNHPSCELQNIQVVSTPPHLNGGSTFSRELDLNSCISLFDVTASPTIGTDQASIALEQAIKEDCSIGLRYFQSVKEALNRDAFH
jgi:hypothetical protein